MKFAVLLAAVSVPVIAAGPSEDLFTAIRIADRAAIARLLKDPAAVNARDARKTTPLMTAAVSGDAELMQSLIAAGAEVNAADAFGTTALTWAATDPRKVALLLKAGANPKLKNARGITALHAAAESPVAFESVRLLVEAGVDVNLEGALGATPLVAAAHAYSPRTARYLIEKGANPKGADRHGLSVLHGPAQFGDVEMVKLLLAKGADANAQNTFGGEVRHGKIGLVGMSPLMLAAAYQGVPVVKALLDAGADVNRQDGRGMTPLMYAVSSEVQNPAVVKLLLARGADTKIVSKAGETALDWARKFGHPEVIKLLGGKPDAVPAVAVVNASLDARTAASKGVALLQKSTTEFFKQSGCVGCHHQNMTAFAANAARKAGLPVDAKAAAEHVGMVKGQWTAWARMNREMWNPPGATDMVVYSLLQLAMENYPADELTEGMAHYLAGKQFADGSWQTYGIARAPMAEGNIARTALNARAMRLYTPPMRKAEFDERIARAARYLAAAEVKTGDDAAMKVLGLVWINADRTVIAKAVKDLEKRQLADGGWAGNPWLSSDAYSTAVSAVALREAGVSSSDAYKKAIAWLLPRQAEDGSWKVASRAPKFQPYFESGFPYAHDQWISAVATAWASVALAN